MMTTLFAGDAAEAVPIFALETAAGAGSCFTESKVPVAGLSYS